VNLYRHTDSRPTAAVLLEVLRQKCDYKSIPVPTFASLMPHRQALEAMWSDMLSHQFPVLPPLNDFWDALPEIFTWMTSSAPVPQRAIIQHGIGEVAIRTHLLPIGVPLPARSTLEIIRFAAANHLCVDLAYDRSVRRIEPYSLRQTVQGYFVLHAIRADSGEHRSHRVDRMQGATVTSQVFTPRYAVELTSTGPLAVAPSTVMPRMPSMRRARSGHQGPTYVYRCTVCGKTFNRKTMDGSLKPHKNRQGYQCYAGYGVYVRTNY
jgi:WYL domain